MDWLPSFLRPAGSSGAAPTGTDAARPAGSAATSAGSSPGRDAHQAAAAAAHAAVADKHSLEFLRSLEPRIRRVQAMTPHERDQPWLQAEFGTDMRDLAEVLVWSDNQKLDDCFSFFIESKIHHQESLVMAILRFFNVFFESVKTGNILYFMLSNNYINQVISVRLDTSSDDILSYYVTLLKNISNKANNRTVNLLFSENSKSYPLFSHAVAYDHHSESMVRTGVRTVILNLLRVNDPAATSFIINEQHYFVQLVDRMTQTVTSLGAYLDQKSPVDAAAELDLFLESLEFLNDVFALQMEAASRALANAFMERVVVMTLVEGLSKSPDVQRVSLFLLARIVAGGINYKPLSDFVVELLFSINPTSPSNSAGTSPIQPLSNARSPNTLARGPTSTRRRIMNALAPTETDDQLLLALSLLHAVLASGVTQTVLQSVNLLPARLCKARRLLDTLMSPSGKSGSSLSGQSADSALASGKSSGRRNSNPFSKAKMMSMFSKASGSSVSMAAVVQGSQADATGPVSPSAESSADKDAADADSDADDESNLSTCDFRLVNRLIQILVTDSMFSYSLLTSQLACHVLVELVGLGGECTPLPPRTQKLLNHAFELWTRRMQTALEVDALNVLDLYDHSATSADRFPTVQSLDRGIAHPSCLIPPRHRPQYSAEASSLIPLNIAVRTWMMVYDSLVKLGLETAPLPPPFDWQGAPSLPVAEACRMTPCVVQVTQAGRLHPPSNLYYVHHDTHFVLAESPVSQPLGACKVVYHVRWPRIKTELVGDDAHTLDVFETWPVFAERRQGAAVVRMEGFDAIADRDTRWKGRLVFGSLDVRDSIRTFIHDRVDAAVSGWRQRLDSFLEQQQQRQQQQKS
ncbi:hypothetical protein BC831DRAFT_456378 [Entophlyctis helioformis]|nr:hypothetical protein BC831DRAFT_456378 [Entophlyctis helioformis]